MTSLSQTTAAALRRLDKARQRRVLTPVTGRSGTHVLRDGRRLLNFSSNDYLGLAQDPRLSARAGEFTDIWGTGSTASRLICGDIAPFEQVEAKLAAAKGKAAALVFNSGFQANATLLPTLMSKELHGAEPLVFCDRLNHASLHHGLAAAGLRQIRFRHNDLVHLQICLEKHAQRDVPKFIVTETVFSMEGDRADLPGLVAIAKAHGAWLIVDEAHATGVLGPQGFGLAAHQDGVDVVMGTFSKALGGFGAYVAADAPIIAYLATKAAGFIYSTALPPAVLGAMEAALELVPTLEQERAHLATQSERLRTCFTEAGLTCFGSGTQIIPVRFGSEATTLAAMQHLLDKGILGVAIRPPTVARGEGRIRLALSAAHCAEQCEQLGQAVLETARTLKVIP